MSTVLAPARAGWTVSPLWLPVALVVALEIPYPLVHGDARNVLTIATVLVFATASLLHAVTTRGTRYGVVLVALAGVGGWAVEVLGVHTGVPFGRYHYTGGLGPAVADVPLIIGVAWLMMAHPAALVGLAAGRRRWVQASLAVAALAGWDVFLDPQMVDARHWTWADRSPHLPGISDVPLSNFGGWVLVSAVVVVPLTLLARRYRQPDDRPMLAVWLWTWLSSTLAAVAFFGHPAVAAWGVGAMGVAGVPLLWRLRRDRRP